jgi:ribosomal-protein-alanine N-acetyltransferase
MENIKTIIKQVITQNIRLETERLILRKITEADLPALFEYASDPEVTQNLRFETHKNLDDTKDYYTKICSWYAGQPDHFPLAIELKQEKKMIGSIDFVHIEFQTACAELGYVLAKKYWGHGYAAEAAKEFIAFGFTQLALHRIEALVKTTNSQSIRVLEKAGMQREGLLRERRKKNNTYYDVYIYSILANEYKKSYNE